MASSSKTETPVSSRLKSRKTPPSWVDVDLMWELELPERNMHRFYHVSLRASLFSPWTLERTWGRIGSDGQRLTVLCDSFEEAFDKLQKLVRRRHVRPIPYLLRRPKVLGSPSPKKRINDMLDQEGDIALFWLIQDYEKKQSSARMELSHYASAPSVLN